MQPRSDEASRTAQAHAAMLPLGVPVHPGLELSASAVVQDDTNAGGDWFDTLPLAGGAVALVAGDVIGHGPAALAAASQLRAAVLLAIFEDPDPASTLTRLAHYAQAVPDAVGSSVCVVVVDPATGELRYAVAGYPPPVVVSAAGHPVPLDGAVGVRLGCSGTYRTGERVLAPGEVLLLASDGFLLPAGSGPVPPPGADLDAWCSLLLHRVADSPGLQDDAVLLGVRRRPVREPLRLCFPAMPDTVGVVRRELAEWLALEGVGPIDTSALLQAISELTSNSVEHAYAAGTDHRRTEVRVDGDLTEGCVLEVEVTDTGHWQPTPRRTEDRGRGLYLAQAFVDELRLDSGPSGTRARIRHRPFRSTAVLTERDVPAHPPPGRGFRLDVSDEVVQVRGSVDPPAADELRLVLGRVSAAGTRPATVELDEVTMLSSAAVEVLSSARTGARGAAPLEIVTGAGTTADRVLTWAGVPHEPGHAPVP